MYKIYIDNNDDELMMKLTKYLKQELLNFDNCIVYTKNGNEGKTNTFEIDAYVYLSDKAKGRGHEVKLEEMSKVSNGLGKEVYNSVQNIHYDKTIDKGLIYMTNIIPKEFNDFPSIVLNIINDSIQEEVKWLEQNMEVIAEAIAKGIITNFTLKLC